MCIFYSQIYGQLVADWKTCIVGYTLLIEVYQLSPQRKKICDYMPKSTVSITTKPEKNFYLGLSRSEGRLKFKFLPLFGELLSSITVCFRLLYYAYLWCFTH